MHHSYWPWPTWSSAIFGVVSFFFIVSYQNAKTIFTKKTALTSSALERSVKRKTRAFKIKIVCLTPILAQAILRNGSIAVFNKPLSHSKNITYFVSNYKYLYTDFEHYDLGEIKCLLQLIFPSTRQVGHILCSYYFMVIFLLIQKSVWYKVMDITILDIKRSECFMYVNCMNVSIWDMFTSTTFVAFV